MIFDHDFYFFILLFFSLFFIGGKRKRKRITKVVVKTHVFLLDRLIDYIDRCYLIIHYFRRFAGIPDFLTAEDMEGKENIHSKQIARKIVRI